MPLLCLVQAGIPEDAIGSMNTGIIEYFKLILVLAAILALAFVALRYVLPRMAGVKRFTTGPITITARLPLEPRKNLYIVKAGSDYFLLGTSESDVHYLTALDSERTEMALLHEDQSRPDPDFSKLVKAIRRPKGSGEGGLQ